MSHHRRITRALCALATCTLLAAPSAWAQAPTEGDISRMRKEVSNEIMSPFCPGKNLDMCTSPNAAAVRRDIQDLAAQGKTKDQIKQQILEQYGEEFRVIPPTARDSSFLLGIIIAGFFAALGLLFVVTRSRKRSGGAQGASTEEPTEAPLSAEEEAYLNRAE